MVKLTYIGSTASGTVKYLGGSINVVRGQTYDVTDVVAEQLLKTTQWKRVTSEEKEESKVVKSKFKSNKD